MKYFVAVVIFFALFSPFRAQAAPILVGGYACVADVMPENFALLREKPTQDAVETSRLEPGDALRITGSEEGWVNVEVIDSTKVSGWIDARVLQGVDDPATCAEVMAKGDAVNPSDEATPVKEQPVPVGAGEEFACVTNLAAGDFLTLREKPSSRSSELARLATGSPLRVIGVEGNWSQVNVLNGGPGSGWVNTNYLELVDDPATCTEETAVNVEPVPVSADETFACVANLTQGDFLTLREKPSASAGQIDHLLVGTPLRITGMDGTWYSVDVLSGEPEAGWVNGKYVELVKDPQSCKGEGDIADTAKPGTEEEPVVGDEPIDPETLCDQEADLDPDGNAIIPAGATEITLSALVQENLGLVSDLFPELDTTTDAFYEKLPCEPSIGGTLPEAVNTEPTADEIEIEAALEDFEGDRVHHLAGELLVNPLPAVTTIASLAFGPCTIDLKRVPCNSPRFLEADQPFEGRDIIYVNGFDPSNLTDWIANTPGARQRWVGPQDPGTIAAYLDPSGYFRQKAREYWLPHIRENLFDLDNPNSTHTGWQITPNSVPFYIPKHNRVLLVAWSTSNTIEYAQAALLTQIQLAMSPSKLNVITPPNYPQQFERPFCSNGCIIISHSTGPLVVSSAMGLAAQGHFGPGGKQIPGRIFAQVAFEGAVAGTRFATVTLAAGVSTSVALCGLFTGVLPGFACTAATAQFLGTSVLRDLVPLVAQNVWGPAVNASPVRTVTVAGGHPSGKIMGLMQHFLPGLDDGVTSMNSACGNPNHVFPLIRTPSGAVVSSRVKAFDFSENGGRLLRSVANFISNNNFAAIPPDLAFLASGCTPFVSPTGMVMPIVDAMGGSHWDARNRYRNYFSFLQATTSHSYDGGSEGNFLDNNPWPSANGLPASEIRHYLDFFGIYTNNIEESMAVTNSAIYARDANGTYLVKPIPVERFVLGRKLSFKIPYPLWYPRNRCPNRWCSWWVWKRTYDMPVGWELRQTSHYVYEFVARR